MPGDYRARPEQVILFRVSAWDANCPQHLPVECTLGRKPLPRRGGGLPRTARQHANSNSTKPSLSSLTLARSGAPVCAPIKSLRITWSPALSSARRPVAPEALVSTVLTRCRRLRELSGMFVPLPAPPV